MKFDFKEPFDKGLDDIVSFISLDSSQRALRFQNEPMEKMVLNLCQKSVAKHASK